VARSIVISFQREGMVICEYSFLKVATLVLACSFGIGCIHELGVKVQSVLIVLDCKLKFTPPFKDLPSQVISLSLIIRGRGGLSVRIRHRLPLTVE
jgi:hypothetical protein